LYVPARVGVTWHVAVPEELTVTVFPPTQAAPVGAPAGKVHATVCEGVIPATRPVNVAVNVMEPATVCEQPEHVVVMVGWAWLTVTVSMVPVTLFVSEAVPLQLGSPPYVPVAVYVPAWAVDIVQPALPAERVTALLPPEQVLDGALELKLQVIVPVGVGVPDIAEVKLRLVPSGWGEAGPVVDSVGTLKLLMLANTKLVLSLPAEPVWVSTRVSWISWRSALVLVDTHCVGSVVKVLPVQ
jgi:hypothetical protein